MVTKKRNVKETKQMVGDKPYAEMTGPELVSAFNELVRSDDAKELSFKEVTKFTSREVGIARLEQLQSAIRARKQGLADEAAREKGGKEPKAKREKKAAEPKAKAEATGLAGEAGMRASGPRAKLTMYLEAHKGSQVPIKEAVIAAYGEFSPAKMATLVRRIEKMRGSLSGQPVAVRTMKGADEVKLTKKNVSEEITVGLHAAS